MSDLILEDMNRMIQGRKCDQCGSSSIGVFEDMYDHTYFLVCYQCRARSGKIDATKVENRWMECLKKEGRLWNSS